MKTLRQVIIEHIKSLNGDGLVNNEAECGCGIEDICLCDSIDIDECQAAKWRHCIYCKYSLQCDLQNECNMNPPSNTDGCFYEVGVAINTDGDRT